MEGMPTHFPGELLLYGRLILKHNRFYPQVNLKIIKEACNDLQAYLRGNYE